MSLNQPAHNGIIRWGVISAANIGVKSVSPAIVASSNGRLAAVSSRNPQRAADLYIFAPDVRIYGDYESLINDPEIDAIYNPLPNGLHAEWTIKALQTGKHVLCEKPMAVTAREGATMLDAAHANDRLLMEAFMYRFHPQTTWALQQVRAGVLGTVRLVRASFSFDIRSHPDDVRLKPDLAGGSLMDIGCYPVNVCRAIYGQPPRAVAARVHVPKAGAVDMATNAVLDYGNGCFGLIDSSFELPERQSVEIIGDAATMILPVPFTPGKSETTVFTIRNGQMSEHHIEGVDQYRLQVEHFARCILAGQEPALRLSETLENLATIEAIYQASGHDWPIM